MSKFRGSGYAVQVRERLFVCRWGVFGPELYLVAKRIRRLAGEAPPSSLAFARRMLAEVMYCEPASLLARAFADAHLEPIPPDGVVLSTSDVEAWLDARASPSVGG